MKNETLIRQKTLGIINVVALLLVKQTANTACAWVFHQPEFPEEANKFRKLKE